MQIEFIPQLALLLFVPFIVTFVALRYILWLPLLQYLEARDHAISGTRHDAEKLVADAEKRATELEKSLQAARDEVAAERAASRKRVGDKQAVILGEARKRAEERLAGAVAEVGVARAAASSQLQPMAVELARDVATSVLGRQVV